MLFYSLINFKIALGVTVISLIGTELTGEYSLICRYLTWEPSFSKFIACLISFELEIYKVKLSLIFPVLVKVVFPSVNGFFIKYSIMVV